MMTIAVLTTLFVLSSLSLSVFFVKLELAADDALEVERSAVSPAVAEMRSRGKGLVIW
ncbi:hypothetical protein [Salidesulfovibrio brasiliensis]|uniref:hypothetical protein n=1 Tax=Salidesulfovibrio brasiliensis TaxID=221711 RepID=UPI0012EEC106|nr:hypothetical protein [Salidesulfovibrio brasiliensis]